MNNLKIRTLLALAVVATLAAGSALGYVLLSPRRTWDSPPNVVVDSRGNSSITDGDLGRTRTRNAILAWNSAGTGTRLSATVGSISGFSLGDGRPMLNFQDPTGACRNNCLAATFTGFYTQRPNGTYRITDADIVTNRQHAWASLGESCSNEFYTEAIHTHEVGHLLGLGHSGVSGATMYPSVSACNNGPASLANDDRAGIQDLY